MEGICNLMPPLIKNSRGEFVDSLLYNSLLKLSGNNRKVAENLYYSATSPTFMNLYKDSLLLDDCNEPTLESLNNNSYFKDLKSNYLTDELININKSFNSGIYTNKDAINKVESFSKNTDFKDKYVPRLITITLGDNVGKVHFSLVKNTPQNVQNLKLYLILANFKEALLDILNKMNISADMVEELIESANAAGTYDTRSPEKAFDNLFHIISIATKEHSDIYLNKTLCEEIGHFMLAASLNSSDPRLQNFYRRMVSFMLLNKGDFYKSLNDYEARFHDTTGAKEADPALEVDDLVLQESETLTGTGREMLGRYLGDVLYFNHSFNEGGKLSIARPSGFLNLISRFYYSALSFFKSMWNLAKAASYGNALGRFLKVNSPEWEKVDRFDAGFKHYIYDSASGIVEAFLNGGLTAEDAFKTPELRHKDTILGVKLSNDILISLLNFLLRFKDRGGNKGVYTVFEESLMEAARERNWYTNSDERTVIEGELSFLNNCIQDLSAFIEEILALDIEGIDDVFAKEVASARNAQELNAIKGFDKKIKTVLLVRDFANTYKNIMTILDSFRNRYSDLWMSYPEIEENLSKLRKDVILGGKDIGMLGIERTYEISKSILSAINGGSAILKREAGIIKRRGMFIHADSEADIADLLKDFAEEDLNVYGIYFNPLSKSTDVISILYERLWNLNKQALNTNLMAFQRSILDLAKEVKKVTNYTDTLLGETAWEWMFERYTKNISTFNADELTGNILQPLKWGEWEAAYDRDMLRKKELILEENAEELAGMNAMERNKYIKEKLYMYSIEWHEANSTVIDKSEVDPDIQNPMISMEENEEDPENPFIVSVNYKPNASYKNEAWDSLGKEKQDLIWKYLSILNRLNSMIEGYRRHSTRFYRAPQFRGNFINTVRNKMKSTSFVNGLTAGVMEGAAATLVETFMEDALDSDFGDLTCYTTENLIVDTLLSERFAEWRRRLPVYGILKVKSSELSTDLLYSTMNYAVMATNIDAMKTTALVCLLGEEALRDRTNHALGSVSERDSNTSGVLMRYLRWLDMEVFGKYHSRQLFMSTRNDGGSAKPTDSIKNRRFNWAKACKKLNGFISSIILSGRIPGATVNTFTGILLIAKEASVKEHFDNKDLANAYYYYVKGVLGSAISDADKDNLGNTLFNKHLDRRNKLYNFIRNFDAQNKNFELYTKMEDSVPAILRCLWGMWMYESGDHLMLVVPFLAKAMHTKLYSTTVFDNNESEKVDYDVLKDLTDEDFKEEGSVWDLFDYEALNQTGFNMEKRDPYHRDKKRLFIKNEATGEFKEWTSLEEANYEELCRMLSNDLHGVYNNRDSPAAALNVFVSSMLTMKKYYLGYINSYWLSARYNPDGKLTLGGWSALKYLLLYEAMLRTGQGGGTNFTGWMRTLSPWRREIIGVDHTTNTAIFSEKKYFNRLGAMATPIVASNMAIIGGLFSGLVPPLAGVFTSLGSSTIYPMAIYAMYSILGHSVFGNKYVGKSIFGEFRKNSYALNHIKDVLGFSQTLVDALKRADANVKMFMLMLILSTLFSFGLFKVPKEDYDNDFIDLDDTVLKAFGIDNYREIAKKYETTGKTGAGGEIVRKNGIAYNLIMDYYDLNYSSEEAKVKLFLAHMLLGSFYYLVNRLRLELETLSPTSVADIAKGDKELKTQINEFFRIAPIGLLYILDFLENLQNITSEGRPNFSYNKDILQYNNFNSLWTNPWQLTLETSKRDGREGDILHIPILGIPILPIGDTMGTFMMGLPGSENKGIRNLYFSLPYFNSAKFFMDPYKAAESYYSGRTMG